MSMYVGPSVNNDNFKISSCYFIEMCIRPKQEWLFPLFLVSKLCPFISSPQGALRNMSKFYV